jgi:MFS family permease
MKPWFRTIGTSIMSPATEQLVVEFGVTRTQAILPLSLYVFALALGPVVGGPLSEMAGRYWVYMISNPIGMLFTLGAGFTHSFVGLCILRFLAGFAFAPSLAIASGTITESFKPAERGLSSTVFVLMPFLGSGVGPVIGAFVSDRKDWRWTQWTIIFFILFSEILAAIIGYETFHPILRRRREKELGRPVEPKAPLSDTIKKFVFVALIRPIAMLFTEPIIALICLYVGCEFATLFSFFAAVPYVFTTVYGFTTEQNGLVFIAVGVGCVLATITVILCNIFFYLKQVPKFPPHKVPPEYRLLPAMIGSIGLPVGLFWFAWTARADVSWASPVIAMIPFAWGNLCVFISTFQFIVDW